MKILVAGSYLHAWNAIRPEAEILIGMAQLGHTVTVMTQGDAEYVTRFREYGLKVIDCYPSRKICLRSIRQMRAELKAGAYDVFYSFNSKTIPNSIAASIGLPVKLVTYRGTTGGLYRHDPTAYLTYLNPRINGTVCVSNAVQRNVASAVWRNKHNVVTIYKGHDLDWYDVTPTPRESLGLTAANTVAICAARVRPSKGIGLLLAATHHIRDENFHLLLVGKGYGAHADDIAASPMHERIHVLGYREDVPALLAMADFHVQPSVSGEGLPRVVVEAMGNGKPSIVTTTGGSAELVDDGSTGYVVDAGDMPAFAEALGKMLADVPRIPVLGAAARAKLGREFTAEKTVSEHLAFFQRLIDQG